MLSKLSPGQTRGKRQFQRIIRSVEHRHHNALPLEIQRDVVRELLAVRSLKENKLVHLDLIKRYMAKYLAGNSLHLDASNPTVHLLRVMLLQMRQSTNPSNALDAAELLLVRICDNQICLLPNALRDICDALPSPAPISLRPYILTLLHRLLPSKENPSPTEPSPQTLSKILQRIVHVAWSGKDCETVTNVLALIRDHNLPFLYPKSIRQILRTLFDDFEEHSNIQTLAYTSKLVQPTKWAEDQAERLESLFASVDILLQHMLKHDIRPPKRVRATLVRGFFGVAQFAASHRELKHHAANAIFVLRLLRVAIQDDAQGTEMECDEDDTSGTMVPDSAMFEMAWADILLRFREQHGPSARIDAGFEMPTSTPIDRKKEALLWSFRHSMRTVINQLWLTPPTSSSTHSPHLTNANDQSSVDLAIGARTNGPSTGEPVVRGGLAKVHFGPEFSGAAITGHRYALLIQNALLSNHRAIAIRHYQSLESVLDTFLVSTSTPPILPSPLKPSHRETLVRTHARLRDVTAKDLQRRLRSSHVRLLHNAFAAIRRDISPRRRATITLLDKKIEKHWKFLLQILDLRPRGVGTDQDQDEFLGRMWQVVLHFLHQTSRFAAQSNSASSSHDDASTLGSTVPVRDVLAFLISDLNDDAAARPKLRHFIQEHFFLSKKGGAHSDELRKVLHIQSCVPHPLAEPAAVEGCGNEGSMDTKSAQMTRQVDVLDELRALVEIDARTRAKNGAAR